ncbi:MAG: hypothetical protein RIC95_09535 [Vicingaceae bacterium]
MMKYRALLIPLLFLLFGCEEFKADNKNIKSVKVNPSNKDKSTKENDYDTLMVDSSIVILLSPDKKQIESLKEKHGEEAFYITADDNLFYTSVIRDSLLNNGFHILESEKRITKFISEKGKTYLVNSDSLGGWGVIFFNGKTKPIFGDIVDADYTLEQFREE